MRPSTFSKRVRNTWKKHGWRMFGPLVLKNIKYHGQRLLATGRIGLPKSSVDNIPGVETHRVVNFSALGYINENSASAHAYMPIGEGTLEEVLKTLPIHPPEFCFVDLGSGKGRALFLAAKAGFRRVIGVEFSEDIHKVAQQNVRAAAGLWENVDRIELVHGDATSYEPPQGPVVLFLYNPFDARVMSQVVNTWSRWVASGTHDVWVIYANPEEADLFERDANFRYVSSVQGCAVYRRRDPA